MPSIKKDDIKKGIEYSKKENLFNKLNEMYNKVPSGDCIGCGNCCMESVGISFVEFLNIYDYLNNNIDIKKIVIPRLIDYYFLEYTKKNSCPFKDENNKCLIYNVRPLNCRIYGHWTKADYEKNYDRIKNENVNFAKDLYENYNIEVNKDILNFKINYCEDFKPQNNYMSKEERMDFYDNLITLDSKLYSKGIININFKDRGIVEYFIESIFFNNISKNIKINITRNAKQSNAILRRIKKLLSFTLFGNEGYYGARKNKRS